MIGMAWPRGRRWVLAAVVMALALAGCGEPERPARRVVIDVDDAGHYALDGRALDITALKSELKLLKAQWDGGDPMDLRIRVAEGARPEQISTVIVATQEAGLPATFATEGEP